MVIRRILGVISCLITRTLRLNGWIIRRLLIIIKYTVGRLSKLNWWIESIDFIRNLWRLSRITTWLDFAINTGQWRLKSRIEWKLWRLDCWISYYFEWLRSELLNLDYLVSCNTLRLNRQLWGYDWAIECSYSSIEWWDLGIEFSVRRIAHWDSNLF